MTYSDSANQTNHPVILFDGVCKLCNGVVNAILQVDRRGVLKFAALQSAFGQKTLEEYGLDMNHFNSILFIDNGKIYYKSGAAIRMTKYLGGVWPLAMVLLIIPPFLRNFIYQVIARNRYRWFGKYEYCRVPNPKYESRFYD